MSEGRHRALVTANTTADIPGPGEGQPWLVSCPACVARSVHAAREAGEPWQGVGEAYVGDLWTAQQLATEHTVTGRRLS